MPVSWSDCIKFWGFDQWCGCDNPYGVGMTNYGAGMASHLPSVLGFRCTVFYAKSDFVTSVARDSWSEWF